MIKSLLCKMFLKNKKENQKGVSLYLAVVILAILLPVAIGLSSIVIFQLKMTRELGNSVVAFYAADSGLEKALYEIEKNGNERTSHYEGALDDGIDYKVLIYCCDKDSEVGENCEFDEGNPCPLEPHHPGETDPPVKKDCEATKFCVRSAGHFKNTKRAIEVRIYPID